MPRVFAVYEGSGRYVVYRLYRLDCGFVPVAIYSFTVPEGVRTVFYREVFPGPGRRCCAGYRELLRGFRRALGKALADRNAEAVEALREARRGLVRAVRESAWDPGARWEPELCAPGEWPGRVEPVERAEGVAEEGYRARVTARLLVYRRRVVVDLDAEWYGSRYRAYCLAPGLPRAAVLAVLWGAQYLGFYPLRHVPLSAVHEAVRRAVEALARAGAEGARRALEQLDAIAPAAHLI